LVVIKPQFENVSLWGFKNGQISVQAKGKWGLIDKKGNFLIEPISESIISFAEELAQFKFNNKYGFIDRKGNIVIEPKYDHATTFKSGLSVVTVDGLTGYIDKKGKYIVTPLYDTAYLFDDNGVANVELINEKGYIGKDENWKLKLNHNQYCSLVTEFHDGLSLIRLDIWKYGFVNKQGELIYESEKADKIPRHFSEGLAQIEKNGKWGYINKNGKIVIEPQFDYAAQFSEGLAAVSIDDKAGYIDKTGEFIIEPVFKGASRFSEGLAWVETRRWSDGGYINKNGEFVIGPQIDDQRILSYGLDLQTEQEKCKNKKEKKRCKKVDYFSNGKNFSERLAAVCHLGSCGYLNKNGEVIVDFKFSRALGFSEGLARVTTDEKWGYIDKGGEIVIEEKFDSTRDFNSGAAMVKIGTNMVTLIKKVNGYQNLKNIIAWIIVKVCCRALSELNL